MEQEPAAETPADVGTNSPASVLARLTSSGETAASSCGRGGSPPQGQASRARRRGSSQATGPVACRCSRRLCESLRTLARCGARAWFHRLTNHVLAARGSVAAGQERNR